MSKMTGAEFVSKFAKKINVPHCTVDSESQLEYCYGNIDHLLVMIRVLAANIHHLIIEEENLTYYSLLASLKLFEQEYDAITGPERPISA